MEEDREYIHDFISKFRPYCITQLQKEVPDYLHERHVLTDEEYQDIKRNEIRENQISCLLDKLEGKQTEKFQIFLQYLLDWYSWITDACKRDFEAMDNSLEELGDILDEGEVPPLPLRSVKRNTEYMKLYNCLCELKKNQYVVVYGMRGCGKSTLVSQVLHESNYLALNFKKVFWLMIGRDCDELTVQQELCSKLKYHSYDVSLPLDSTSAKKFLKNRVKNDDHSECLLILDDVSSSSFVEALDIGCKILITTDDKHIMSKTSKPVQYIKVSEGFTEEETLDLFSKSIGNQRLPSQAKNIHAICKGFPLTISLISSQLAEHKEDALENEDLWDAYVSELKDGGISAAIGRYDKHRSEQVTLLYRAIGMSIDGLTSELKQYYQTMALFMNDVNIKPEVLCTLWERSKKTVLGIMEVFEKKCLVTRAWNRVKKSYIYCVHDLLLDYLKRKLSEQEKKKLHLHLIRNYRSKYGDDFNNFPVDDNYILLYLGYHLKEADLVDEFPKVYLNLLFVEKKILSYGAADLLLDYKRYKALISNNEKNTRIYEDFVCFINRVAACLSISNSNIVQFGLFEAKENAVYKCAKELALSGVGSRSVDKYFHLLTDAPKEDCTVFHGLENIVAATFTQDGDILVANESGEIRRINTSSHCTVKRYSGHTNRVTSLQLAKNLMYFLSASDDATVRIWCVNGHLTSDQHRAEKPRTPSPQLRQTDYHDPWGKLRCPGESADVTLEKHREPIKCAQFSNSELRVVSAAGSEVIVWTLVMENNGSDLKLTLCDSFNIIANERFGSCNFTNDDKSVVCSTFSGNIFVYNSINGCQQFSISVGHTIKSMIIIPDLSDVSAFILNENTYYVSNIGPGPEKLDNSDTISNRRNQTYGRKRRDQYICAAVSWNGKYVAIASTNSNIFVRDIDTGEEILKFYDSNGRICDLCWSRQNDSILASYSSKVLKIFNVQNNSTNSVKLRHSLFDAAWIPDPEIKDEGFFISAAVDNCNRIHVFNDVNVSKILDNGEVISQLCVCPVNGNIFYACKSGKVYLVELDTLNDRVILNTSSIQVSKMKTFNDDRRLFVVILVETTVGKSVLISWITELNTAEEKRVDYKSRFDVVMDYVVDVNKNLLYAIDRHSLIVYDASSGSIKNTVELEMYSVTEQRNCDVRYWDISANCSFLASFTDERLYLRTISNWRNKYVLDLKNSTPKMCKFSVDEKYLAVGFFNGAINVYEIDQFPKTLICSIENSKSGPVIDVVWSSTNSRFIVIFDKEISLYEILSTRRVILLSVLYMSIDKLLCNPSFNVSVTVDSSGHFRALKHPF